MKLNTLHTSILIVLIFMFAFYLGKASEPECITLKIKQDLMQQQECFIMGKLAAQEEYVEQLRQLNNYSYEVEKQ